MKEVPDPENFGVVAYDERGNVTDIVEKAGRGRHALRRAAVQRRRRRPLLLPAGRVRDHRRASQPSSRGELEITDVNRVYAQRGELEVRRVEGWWHDGGKHWADLADLGRLIEETGANK